MIDLDEAEPGQELYIIHHNVLEWAEEKGIFDKSNATLQGDKLQEEVDELLHELTYYQSGITDNLESKLELGDCLVVLTLIAKFLDSNLEECYQLAYDKISKRTGQMKDGVFVKDE